MEVKFVAKDGKEITLQTSLNSRKRMLQPYLILLKKETKKQRGSPQLLMLSKRSTALWHLCYCLF